MNHSRYNRLLESQTVAARKVFVVIPTDEAWTTKKIYTKLRQMQDTSSRNMRVVEGCINTLVEAGLVKEHPRGHFTRIVPTGGKDTTEDEVIETKPAPVVEVPPPAPAPLKKPEPAPEPVKPTIAKEPFHIVTEAVTPQPDREYEYYLNIRHERAVNMLQLLTSVVDEEMGLALLEIAEDLEETHTRQLDYLHGLSETERRRLVVNAGWYQHEVDGKPYFSTNERLSVAELELCRKQRRYSMEALAVMSQGVQKDDERQRDAIFRKFEPNGEGDRPYYDSLLDKLKNHVPDLEPVAELEVEMPKETITATSQQRKARRGLCDIKIQGISQAPEYRAWTGVIAPSNVTALAQQGLTVDERWQSFKVFLGDVGYRPEYGARLMRIEKDKGWFKENVEWRIGGKPVEPRLRAPKGWPLMAERDNAERELSRIMKETRARIDATFGD